MDLHAIQNKLTKILGKAPIGTIVGGLSACGTAYYLYHVITHKLQQSRKLNPLPPGPTPLPLIGSLHKVVKHFGPDGNPRIHRGLADLSNEYGPIFGLFMGSYYTVVISDPKLAHEAFIKVE